VHGFAKSSGVKKQIVASTAKAAEMAAKDSSAAALKS
jgi:hypothetical protein